MKNLRNGIIAFSVILSAVANAEQSQSLTTAAAPAESKVIGLVDIRPSWTTKSGSVGTENVIEAGYQFSPTRTLSYLQEVYSNIYDPTEKQAGANLRLGNGFLRTRLSNLYVDKSLGLSLSYQNRTYTPISEGSQKAGHITTMRNYFNLKKALTEKMSLTLSEIPIFHVYDRGGQGEKANPVFENRVYLITDISLMKDVSFSFPLMFHQTRNTAFEGAKNSGAWEFVVWTYPELTYAVTANTSLGLAYYSGNLVAGDLSSLNIGSGLEGGVFQVVMAATL